MPLSPPTLRCLGWSRSCAPETSWMASKGTPWGVSPTGMETDAQRPGLPPADPPIGH
jgi:hypothetical protein